LQQPPGSLAVRPEERRVGFVDDFGGKIELSTQQLRNLIALLVSEDFWLITGL